MAGYNVQTPPLFTVRDPQQLVDFNLNRLNASFTFPEKTTEYASTGSGVSPYSAEDLIGSYIIRRGQGNYDDYLDSAANIVDALRRKLLSIANYDRELLVGTSFSCILYNDSSDYVYINGLTGTHVCDKNAVADGCAVKMTFTITDLETLGDNHSDAVNVFICGAYYDGR
jgi:hypothetical protein